MLVCVYTFFFCFFFFVKDFSATTAPRILTFSTNIEYDLYCVRDNQHPHANHFLFCPFFFFSTISFFVTDFLAPIRARVFIFCIHLQRVEVYCVKEDHDAEFFFSFFHLSLQ